MDKGDLRRSIENLTPEQRAMLEERIRGRAKRSTGVPRRQDPNEYPLSPGQRRLWAMARLRPKDPVYNLVGAWRLSGEIDIDALEHAFKALLERHETLRARFVENDGEVSQLLLPVDDFRLEVEEVETGTASTADITESVDRLASTPFDTNRDYLIKATIVTGEPGAQILVIVAHHLVCDGWSMGLVVDELSAFYNRRVDSVTGNAGPEPEPLPVSYFDVAQWLIDAGTDSADLKAWRQVLDRPLEGLRLPTSTPPVRGPMMGADSTRFGLDPLLSERIRELARSRRLSEFAVLLAGFLATLHRTTNQANLIVCTPMANRPHKDTEGLVGYFNNLVPLVVDIDPDEPVSGLMSRCADIVAEALDRAGVPFQDVVRLPEVSSTPLTRCLFVLQDGAAPRPAFDGVMAEPVTPRTASADFDLALFLRPEPDRFSGSAVVRSSQFDSSDVDLHLRNFDAMLAAITAEPDTSMANLPDLSAGNTPADEEVDIRARVPESLLEAQMVALWSDVFGTSVRPDENFFDIGGHSLLAAELIDRVVEQFDLPGLPLSMLFEAPTASLLAKAIAGGVSADSWTSLVPIKPTGDQLPLFFVHAHGGNVIGYSDLARALSDGQPLYGLQAPPIDDNGPADVREMAAAYVSEIRTVQTSGPYLVGGWCLGGDIAFEMAHQLRRAGEEVALVLMVDNPRPDIAPTAGFDRVMARAEMELALVAEQPVTGLGPYAVDRIGRIAERGLVGLERLVERAGDRLPFGLRHSRAYARAEAARTRERAYQGYEPEPYPGRVALFRAAREARGRRQIPGLGWDRFVTGRFDEYRLPGHRIGLLSEPRVGESARIIEEAIRAAVDPEG